MEYIVFSPPICIVKAHSHVLHSPFSPLAAAGRHWSRQTCPQEGIFCMQQCFLCLIRHTCLNFLWSPWLCGQAQTAVERSKSLNTRCHWLQAWQRRARSSFSRHEQTQKKVESPMASGKLHTKVECEYLSFWGCFRSLPFLCSSTPHRQEASTVSLCQLQSRSAYLACSTANLLTLGPAHFRENRDITPEQEIIAEYGVLRQNNYNIRVRIRTWTISIRSIVAWRKTLEGWQRSCAKIKRVRFKTAYKVSLVWPL